MVTIKDVAREAGVSVSTVSHVVNETRYVAPDTTTRVLEAIEKLGYSPSFVARALKGNKTRTIGMIVTNSTNPFFAEAIRGVEDTCFKQGYSLILCNSDDAPDKQMAYLQTLLMKRIDGLLVMTSNQNTEFYDRLRKLADLPKVIMDADDDNGACVIKDDSVYGGRLATEFLIERGYHKIGCITGPVGHPRSRDRLSGFRAAMDAAGHDVREAWIVEGDLHLRGSYRAMCRLFEQHKTPDAIFAFNDLAAMGVMRAVQEQGLRVPEDMAVIGYDDIELAAFLSPPLTTVHQPIYELGSKAAAVLIKRLEDPSADRVVLNLKPRLVVRNSVGVCKKS